MFGLESWEIVFVASAFLFQVVLIIHFALRKWAFNRAMRYGPIVYALSIPAAAVSEMFLLGGKAWSFWLSGFIYLMWAVFEFIVKYVKHIQWRSPIRMSMYGPYVFLYLAAVMFYWWPLALVSKPLRVVYASLFIISTILNVTSHRTAQVSEPAVY